MDAAAAPRHASLLSLSIARCGCSVLDPVVVVVVFLSDPGGLTVNPKYLDTVPNVTWNDHVSLWVTANKVPLDNIWYFASRTSPIYKARRSNRTGSLPFVLPPLTEQDVIFMPDPTGYLGEDSKDWCQNFFQVRHAGRVV